MKQNKNIKFGELFSKTLNDYKNNFGSIFKFMFVFLGIPTIVLLIFKLFFVFSDDSLFQFLVNSQVMSQNFSGTYPLFGIIMILISLIYFVFFIFVQAGLFGMSVKKSKFDFRQMMFVAKESFFRYFSLSIVMVFFLALLFLLLVIPGVIFFVYWSFAVYFLYDKKKGILASLKSSKKLVRGCWWKVFGYSIFILLIIGAIYFAVSFVIGILSGIVFLFFGASVTKGVFAVQSFFDILAAFIINLIYIPILVIFYRNFYFKLKKMKGKR